MILRILNNTVKLNSKELSEELKITQFKEYLTGDLVGWFETLVYSVEIFQVKQNELDLRMYAIEGLCAFVMAYLIFF